MSGLNQWVFGAQRLLVRGVLVLVGLVFAASVLAALALLGAVWALRALWARLTGRPVRPWVTRFDVGQGFRGVVRRGAWGRSSGDAHADVTDVQAREVREDRERPMVIPELPRR